MAIDPIAKINATRRNRRSVPDTEITREIEAGGRYSAGESKRSAGEAGIKLEILAALLA